MDNNFIEDIIKEQACKDEAAAKSIQVVKEVPLNLDLGHLTVFDTNLIDVKTFRSQTDQRLQQLTRDNIQIFINNLWELDTERIEGSVIAKLPIAKTSLPRSKRIPKPKPPTKWELFAKKKGIQKKRRDNLVWDEQSKEFRPRYGFRSKQNQEAKEWVVEVKGDQDPEEAFGLKKKKKNERVAKNELRRLQNIARSSGKKFANNKDSVHTSLNTSCPEKKELAKAAFLAKSSTASLGKFQEKAVNEKPMKGSGGKKRKFEPNEGNISGEKDKNMKLLQEILISKPKINVKKAVFNEESAKRSQSDVKIKKTRLSKEHSRKAAKKSDKSLKSRR